MKAEIEVDDELWQRALVIVGMDALPGEIVTVALETLVAEFDSGQVVPRAVETVQLPE